MMWPWSKEKKIPKGVTVLDVSGAQLIVVRVAEGFSHDRMEPLREHIKSAFAGTALNGVRVIVLGDGIDLSVLTKRNVA